MIQKPKKMLIYLNTVLVHLILLTLFVHTNNNSCDAAPMNSFNKSTTVNGTGVEPESTSSRAPLYKIPRQKTQTTVHNADNNANETNRDYDSEQSSEIYELKLVTKNKNNKKNQKQKVKINNQQNKDEDTEDLLAEFSQGYKKVYSKISHWWRDLESSFSVTPISYEGPSKKVKKESSSFIPENKSKSKPTTKKPATKKKPAKTPAKKKDQKQREPESWFDWNKVILVLGSIVTVLDLFGIR